MNYFPLLRLCAYALVNYYCIAHGGISVPGGRSGSAPPARPTAGKALPALGEEAPRTALPRVRGLTNDCFTRLKCPSVPTYASPTDRATVSQSHPGNFASPFLFLEFWWQSPPDIFVGHGGSYSCHWILGGRIRT